MVIDLPGIPDTVNPIYIFVGEECWAYKQPNTKWMVKTTPCNKCGECCKRFKMNYDFPPISNGVCGWLDTGGECELGRHRPFKCAIANPSGKYCSVKFKEL